MSPTEAHASTCSCATCHMSTCLHGALEAVAVSWSCYGPPAFAHSETLISRGTGASCAGAVSAVDLYRTHLAARRIVTFSSDLDRILGGGVFTGQVTEFCECCCSWSCCGLCCCRSVWCTRGTAMCLSRLEGSVL